MSDTSCPNNDVAAPSIRPSTDHLDVGGDALGRLRRAGYLAFRDLSCNTEGADLYLKGRLPSHYLKQLAQAIAGEVEGVRRVINCIEVVSGSARRNLGNGTECRAGAANSTRTIAPARTA
jgi:hypothetical protein